MSYTNITADIKNKLTAIPAIGVVNDYERWTVDMARFLELFTRDLGGGKKEVRGWEFSRVAAPEAKRGNAFFRHHRFKLAGYLGLNDAAATEKTFQALIDTICAAFRTADPAADDAAPWWYMDGQNPNNSCIQVQVIDTRIFGAVLCHHADIFITVTERIIQ